MHLKSLAPLLLTLLLGCAPAAQPATTPAKVASPAPASSPAKPSASPSPGSSPAVAASPAAKPQAAAPPVNYDDPSWRQLIEAAKAEGKLIVASGPNPDTRRDLPAAFKQRFGIEMEYLGGRSSELATRLAQERASGVYSIDVIIGGGDTTTRMFTDGWLQPIKPHLITPESRDPAVWQNGVFPFLEPSQDTLLNLEAAVLGEWLVNPEIVKEGEIKSLDDLLNPKWKGKISVEDPTVPGQGLNNGFYIYLLKGEDFFRKLYLDQQPGISRDDRQMADWLARGSHPITFGLTRADAETMSRDGLPVKVLGNLDAPGWLSGGFSVVGMFDKQPNPNAAKLFVNWITSQEGLALHAKSELQVPGRRDVPAPWVHPDQVPREGVDYFNFYQYEHVTQRMPVLLQTIKSIMGS